MVGPMNSKAEACRGKAREALAAAEATSNPETKRQLEEMARQWQRVAEQAERHGW
jgi:hypothetical protein